MAVTLNKANLVLKDANGNIGKIEQLSSNDLAKIKTAVSDVALVVNQSNHTPIEATTTNKGVVQLATSADVVSGASDKVVTAEQLHNATTGTSALATENLARIDAVVTEAGIPINHTNTNQLKTAVTTLISNATPATATANTLGVVKPDNDTITIDSNGVLTATSQMPGVATTSTVGVVKPDGSTITVDGNGTLTATAQMPGVATTSSVGVVQPDGRTITITADGVISAIGSGGGSGSISSVVGEIKWFAFNTVPDGYLVCNGASVSRETYADLFAVIGTLYGKGDGINATSKFGTAVFDGEDGNSIRVTVATNESDASSFDVSVYYKGSLVETQTVKKATKLVNNSYITWDTSVALVAGDDVSFTGGTGSTFNLPDMRDRFAEGAGTYSVGTAVEAGLPNITGNFTLSASTGGMEVSAIYSGAFNPGTKHPSSWVTSSSYPSNEVSFDASRSNSIYGNSTTVQPPALTFLPCIKY